MSLTKDQSFYDLYDNLSRGISDYSCNDFINKAQMLFPKIEEIKNILNNELSQFWKDPVQVETETKTEGPVFSTTILNAKSFVEDVVSPLVSNNHVEDLKNKLKDYIDAYDLYYKQYKNVKIDDEEFERNKPPIPLAKDYEGGINNEAYKEAYETYKEYVADFQKIYDAVTKSENFVRKKHSECEDLITKINGILNKSSEAPAASLDGVAVASSDSSTKSDNGLIPEIEEMIDENGNKHVTTTMKNADGNVVSKVKEITDKNGNIISTLKIEYYENGKIKNKHYDDKVGHDDYNIEYDIQGRNTRFHIERYELSNGNIYEDYDCEYLYDENTQVINVGKVTYADGVVKTGYYENKVNDSTVDLGYSESYNADGVLTTKDYKQVTEGDVTTITIAESYNADGVLTKKDYNQVTEGDVITITIAEAYDADGSKKVDYYQKEVDGSTVDWGYSESYNADGVLTKKDYKQVTEGDVTTTTTGESYDADGSKTVGYYKKEVNGSTVESGYSEFYNADGTLVAKNLRQR